MIYKEKFDLSDLPSATIDDFRNKIEKNDGGVGKVGLLYANVHKEPFLVEADYQRVIQLVFNILNNAITFTKEEEDEGVGNIYITVEKRKKDNNSSQVSVIVL